MPHKVGLSSGLPDSKCGIFSGHRAALFVENDGASSVRIKYHTHTHTCRTGP